MLHGFNFSKLFFLSTLIFTYSNASNSHIQYQDLYCGYAAHTRLEW